MKAAVLPAAEARASAGVAMDTLSVEAVLSRETARIDSLLYPESGVFDTAGVDSLLRLVDARGFEFLESLDPA